MTRPVTAEELTDEQIVEMRAYAARLENDCSFALLRINAKPTRDALERIAAAINARGGK